jgi:hypothetical protein
MVGGRSGGRDSCQTRTIVWRGARLSERPEKARFMGRPPERLEVEERRA